MDKLQHTKCNKKYYYDYSRLSAYDEKQKFMLKLFMLLRNSIKYMKLR